MPTQVRDGENDGAFGVNDEEHTEAKPMEDGAPDLAKDGWEAQGTLVDS
jgi:hypothetical protein